MNFGPIVIDLDCRCMVLFFSEPTEEPPVTTEEPPVTTEEPPVTTKEPEPVTTTTRKPKTTTTRKPVTTTTRKPGPKECHGTYLYGHAFDEWCNENCNAMPPFCPKNMCECD